MATMIGLFSSIGEHVPLFKRAKMLDITAESTVNRSVRIEKETAIQKIRHKCHYVTN